MAGRVFHTIPRNIRHLEQAELFALIDVGGTWQRHLHKHGDAGALGAELLVQRVGGAIAQHPVLGELVVFAGRHLRQAVAGGVADHIVVAHHPCGGGAGAFGAGDTLFDGLVHGVANPVLLGELEVEDLSQIVGTGVQVLAVGLHPCLGHGERRRIVLVEDLAPLVVDLMHFVAVDYRVRAVIRLVGRAPHHVVVEIVAVEILGQTVGHIHAETIGTVVEPEAQRGEEVVAYLAVVPVPVGLLLGEHVQVPLAVGHAGPGRAAEVVLPVGGRLVAVRAFAVAEDVAVAFGGAGGVCFHGVPGIARAG